MFMFTENEIIFLESMEKCRVATSHDNIPHVKPVSYLLVNDEIYIATDYKTRMYKNLLKNPNIAISIDIYKPKDHKAICVQGNMTILEKGEEFLRIYEKFFEKFEWVRDQP